MAFDVAFINNGDIAEALPFGIPYVAMMVRL